jgi:hypothetical protein
MRLPRLPRAQARVNSERVRAAVRSAARNAVIGAPARKTPPDISLTAALTRRPLPS